MSEFVYGTVTVPDGKRGPWQISTFTVNAEDLHVWMMNARALRDGYPERVVHSGTYRRLTHKERGCVMSNTRMEILTSQDAYDKATGRVLVAGLGLGMVVEGMLNKPDVTEVVVVEIDKDVIRLVGPHLLKKYSGRISIHTGSIHNYVPEGKFDFAWFDIWDEVSTENLTEMKELKAKFRKHCKASACWSQREAQREARRY